MTILSQGRRFSPRPARVQLDRAGEAVLVKRTGAKILFEAAW